MNYAEPKVGSIWTPEHGWRVIIRVIAYSPAEAANIVASSPYFKPVPRIGF